MKSKLIVAEAMLVAGLLLVPSPALGKYDPNIGGRNTVPVTWGEWREVDEAMGQVDGVVDAPVVTPAPVPTVAPVVTPEKEQGRREQRGPFGPNGQGQGEPKTERKGGE